MGNSDLIEVKKQLKIENAELKRKVATLERMVAVLENRPQSIHGLYGEAVVASLLKGDLSAYNASHDVQFENKKLRLEVKFSTLNMPSKVTNKTQRWAWSKPFGDTGKKVYDRLILIAEKDPRYIDVYNDPSCLYIFFDVPFDEIMPLTIQTNAGRYRSINLTTNPATVRSNASPLFSKYQITIAELEKRYGIKGDEYK